eukprot:jgi/Botrbrau1/14483/Bobra.0014s0119.3
MGAGTCGYRDPDCMSDSPTGQSNQTSDKLRNYIRQHLPDNRMQHPRTPPQVGASDRSDSAYQQSPAGGWQNFGGVAPACPPLPCPMHESMSRGESGSLALTQVSLSLEMTSPKEGSLNSGHSTSEPFLAPVQPAQAIDMCSPMPMPRSPFEAVSQVASPPMVSSRRLQRSASGFECDPDVWQMRFHEALNVLRRKLELPPPHAPPPEELKELAKAVIGVLDDHREIRNSAIRTGHLAEVAAGMYLSPHQRLMMWMGGLRPTDYVNCACIKIGASGERIADDKMQKIAQLADACRQQQQGMSRAYEELSEKLARATVMSQFVRQHSMGTGGGRRPAPAQPSAAITGIVDSMAVLMKQADDLRMYILDQLAVLLTPHQLAYAVLAVGDILNTNTVRPALPAARSLQVRTSRSAARR